MEGSTSSLFVPVTSMTPTENPLRTMRAWILQKRGSLLDVLSYRSSFPRPPEPNDSNLLIRISYAALNPADEHLARGIPSFLRLRRNPIAGLDFSGRIESAGKSAPEPYNTGTEVCGTLGSRQVLYGTGSLAEYIVVPSELVALKPKNLSIAKAAGLGISGQTAILMLSTAKIRNGSKVLVNGGSSSIGSFVIQAAKGLGAHIVATCSEANTELVKSLGADEVIDYRANHPLHTYLAEKHSKAPFDYILDCIRSQDMYENSPRYLKSTGIYINVGNSGGTFRTFLATLKNYLLPTFLGGTPRKFLMLSIKPCGELQRKVVSWVNDGLIKDVLIDSEFEMDEVVKGFERVISSRSKGKVLINVSGE